MNQSCNGSHKLSAGSHKTPEKTSIPGGETNSSEAKKARLDINFEDPLEPDGDLAFTFLG